MRINVGKRYLHGFYAPIVTESLDDWEKLWSMGPHAEEDWIWFDADLYSDAEIKKRLREAKWQ